MRLRASLAISISIFTATAALAGCHHAAGKIMADTTLLPYKAPDIDDITGIDSDADASDATSPASAAGAATGSAAAAAHPGGK